MANGRVITFKQAADLWGVLPEKLAVNLLNFEVSAAKALKRTFQESFYLHRFNASGQAAWKPHSSKWVESRGYTPHELLYETGNLKRSITYDVSGSSSSVRSISVYSNPDSLASSRRQYGRNFYYAAVHNFGTDSIPQRQFIGYSDVAISRIDALARRYIFDGFPK